MIGLFWFNSLPYFIWIFIHWKLDSIDIFNKPWTVNIEHSSFCAKSEICWDWLIKISKGEKNIQKWSEHGIQTKNFFDFFLLFFANRSEIVRNGLNSVRPNNVLLWSVLVIVVYAYKRCKDVVFSLSCLLMIIYEIKYFIVVFSGAKF